MPRAISTPLTNSVATSELESLMVAHRLVGHHGFLFFTYAPEEALRVRDR